MYVETLEDNDVTPYNDVEASHSTKMTQMEWIVSLQRGNTIMIMTFPSLNVVFYAIYFQLSVY